MKQSSSPSLTCNSELHEHLMRVILRAQAHVSAKFLYCRLMRVDLLFLNISLHKIEALLHRYFFRKFDYYLVSIEIIIIM